MTDPPRFVTAYGDAADLAGAVDHAYGDGAGDGLRARDVVEGLPDAELAADVMAQRERLAPIADRLRAEPAVREAMLADVERDLAEAVDPDRIARLLRMRDWLDGLAD
jgi:hypothetical protein